MIIHGLYASLDVAFATNLNYLPTLFCLTESDTLQDQESQKALVIPGEVNV